MKGREGERYIKRGQDEEEGGREREKERGKGKEKRAQSSKSQHLGVAHDFLDLELNALLFSFAHP